ncbi:tryptophan 2,3-dioxygenase [Streptomyces sp. or20]|uniref:tryptophan 2,3-dioxygenase n=1 Tax=Streptomyces sp. or20 TaxID=1828016 RepID=UPI001C54C11C|nr:tryptophan 2,3-dioxygenase [Streptomyces sp. or20]
MNTDTELPSPLAHWLRDPVTEDFPYPAVVSVFQRVGKQRVAATLLAALAEARTRASAHSPLARFLDVALDKHDGRYDYSSYLAIDLFPEPADTVTDRVVTLLVADVLAFELAALDGADVPLPGLRPDRRTVGLRCRHGLRALARSVARTGGPDVPEGEPAEAARVVVTAVEESRTPQETHLLRTTLLPVDTVHDEYLFLRVLQSFEMHFALSSRHMATVPDLLDDGDTRGAGAVLGDLADRFDETAHLFSLLATMQVEAFRTFRLHTEGASAIQSNNYKRLESLCRRPDPGRLASAAYDSVPVVRDEVNEGRRTVDEALAALGSSSSAAARAELEGERQRFAAAYERWRRTHHRLAVRMLGDQPGSGYTAGVPYLAEARTVPVFET